MKKCERKEDIMTKKKTLKKALLSSVLALVLCFTMLIGTTYAWFTDSVTSSGNIIKSGTLNIDLGIKTGTDDDYVSVKENPTKKAFDYDKWEPGYTEWVNAKVTTTGNLALKYTMKIKANGAVSALAEVIDVYYKPEEVAILADGREASLAQLTRLGTLADALAGTIVINDTLIPGTNDADFATLALHMQESAGNEYQDKSIGTSFSLQILATQYTYEEDSFDDQYDALAEYPVQAVEVTDASGLLAALADGAKSIVLAPGDYGTLTLDGDTDIEDVTIDADDAQMLMDIQSGAKLANVTIKNYAPTGTTGNSDGSVTIRNGSDVDITFEDSTFKPGAGWAGVRTYDQSTSLKFKNCSFDGTSSKYAVYCASGPIDDLELYGCTFENFNKRVILLNGSYTEATTIIIDGCTFKNSTSDGILKALSPFADGSTFTFKDNVLENFSANEGFFTTNKSDVTAPIDLTNPTFTVDLSNNTKDGEAWVPQGLTVA